LWVLIAVHKGCIYELCGVRQRRARWAQELESSTEKKTLEVLEYLKEARLWRRTQLQTETLFEFCEALPSGH
jgi:hypothetical protein